MGRIYAAVSIHLRIHTPPNLMIEQVQRQSLSAQRLAVLRRVGDRVSLVQRLLQQLRAHRPTGSGAGVHQ